MSAWGGLTLAFGLLVTVLGFETSRYLGETNDAQTRIRSMWLAQGVATLIYMAFICLLASAFAPDTMALNETAIIDMTAIVATILPLLLLAAALSAQASAAIANTSGSDGLIAELTRGDISTWQGYALLVATALVLTWTADVFQIIQPCLARLCSLLRPTGGDCRLRRASYGQGRTPRALCRGLRAGPCRRGVRAPHRVIRRSIAHA